MWAARLLVGPGGQGKTRLARELARVMSSQNWATVIVAEHARIADLSLLAELQEPTLIVVDYAEARGEQLEAIARAVARTESKVRLLLLARTGSWRTELSKSSHLRFLVGVPIDQLDPVDPGPVGRQEAWNQAVIALASRLGDLDGYRSVDWPGLAHGLIAPTLSAPRYRVILEVQINALATLLRAGPQEAAAYTDDPMDILLEHERQYWNRTAQQLGVALSEETQRCVVAYASLYGAVNRDEADRVLARIPGVRDLGEDAQASICHWLATLYQGEERYWSRPQPDRLAEHLVGTSLGQGICRRKRALEISIAEVSDDQLEQALGLLVQTLVHHPSIAGTIIAAIAHGGLRAAAAAAAVVPRAEQRQPLLEALDNYIDSAPLDDLTALMDRLPRHGLSARTMRRLARVELLRPLSEPQPRHLHACRDHVSQQARDPVGPGTAQKQDQLNRSLHSSRGTSGMTVTGIAMVEVFAHWRGHPTNEPEWLCGSGYEVSSRLVMTAAHVVSRSGRPLEVIQIRGAAGELQVARVCWYRDDEACERRPAGGGRP